MKAALPCFALFAALFAGAAGCAPSTAPSAPSPPPRVTVSDSHLDARRLLGTVAARAITAGAGPLEVVAVGVAADGDRVGGFVEVPAGACVVAYARGSTDIRDLDLHAFEDDGSAFMSDESPNEGAAVLVCPPHPRRLFIAGRVVSGSGIVAVGVQAVSESAAPMVARAVGARVDGEETGRLASWPGLEAKINRHREGLGTRWEDVRRVAIPVDPHATSHLTVGVDAGRCVDVLVVPSDELGTLEVVAYDEDGVVITRARPEGRERTFILCSSDRADVDVAVRPHAAHGLVAVVVGRSEVGAEAELLDVAQVSRVSQTLTLADARAELERAVADRGFDAAKTVGTGKARIGSRVTLPLAVTEGCARIDVIAGEPLSTVAADLWGETGALLASSRGSLSASLFHCGPAGKLTLDVEAVARPGPFAVELRRARAAPKVLVDHPLAASRLLDRLDSYDDPVDTAVAANAVAVALTPDRLERRRVVVPANRCLSAVVATDAGGQGVELRLVDVATGQDRLARAAFVVADRTCAGSSPREVSAEIRLRHGSSDVVVLTRIEP